MKLFAWRIPKDGERRIRVKFCWFPRWTSNDVVWLEKVLVTEEYHTSYVDCGWELVRVERFEKNV
jgi:hypothetical protein